MQLFQHIRNIALAADCAEEKAVLVIVLVDEVESICMSRSSFVSSNDRGGGGGSGNSEPADAVRGVNAVLTGIDSLKHLQNVLVLCTSNMIHSIDPVKFNATIFCFVFQCQQLLS